MKKQRYIPLFFFLLHCTPEKSDEDDNEDEQEESDNREGAAAGDCNDGIDNDEDGEIDCDDPGCEDKPACTDAQETGSPTGDTGSSIRDTGEQVQCGGTPPVIHSIVCENSGIVEHPDNGPLPTFTLRMNATDADGDLNFYEIFTDLDSQLNGVKDPDAVTLSPVQGTLSTTPCDVNEANVSVTIYLNSGPPEFNTKYEWFVQISDAYGKISEPFMVECRTPNADGVGNP